MAVLSSASLTLCCLLAVSSAAVVVEGTVPLDDIEEVEDLINYNVDPELLVTDAELATVSSQIWAQDDNRFPSRDLSVNHAGPIFFTYVNEGRFGRTTYNRFIPLLDNFIPHYGVAEPPCSQCRSAEDLWLNDVINTRAMRTTWDFLVSKGLASSDFSTFKRLLKQLWFQFYSRSRGPIDSCGFEHVFVGELDRGSVKGFHNWVQTYLQEKDGEWRLQTSLGTCSADRAKLRFNWAGGYKPIGSLFLGPSPEFELSIFTLCFLARPTGSCRTNLGGSSVTITTYSMSGVSPRTISTAYPVC